MIVDNKTKLGLGPYASRSLLSPISILTPSLTSMRRDEGARKPSDAAFLPGKAYLSDIVTMSERDAFPAWSIPCSSHCGRTTSSSMPSLQEHVLDLIKDLIEPPHLYTLYHKAARGRYYSCPRALDLRMSLHEQRG